MPYTSTRRPWRHPLVIGLALTAALTTIFFLGFVTSDHPPSRPTDTVVLVPVPGGVGATSRLHGPSVTESGRARGFVHDETGAAIAASNLAARVSVAAGREIYEPTILEQTFGDSAGTLAAVRADAFPPPPDATPTPTIAESIYYRVIGGDPNGEYVVVSLLADTEQARALGGLARIDLTLRWITGDWRLRVPIPAASLRPDALGYALLGKTS
ncbi:MAG: hypothetical protein J0I49_08575 [Pseudonocardia sp.]|nr:hypothetical protein [Pseudonocardia sp.]